MNRSARRSTSLSPPDVAGDPPLDAASGDAAAALLASDRLLVVAVPRLADLDVLELEEEAGDTMLPSTSSRPGGREPKLRPRRGAARASSIHRVAPEESRNRTFLIASRRVPRIDDRFLLLHAATASSSSVDGGRAPETVMDDDRLRVQECAAAFSPPPRRRVGVVTGNASRASNLLSCTLFFIIFCLVCWLAAWELVVYIGGSNC
jgi:hypothetical protein